MSNKLWLYGLGLVASLALLAAPQSAQAQHYHRHGSHSNYGRVQIYSPGYGNYGRTYSPGHSQYQPGYNSYYPGYGGGYGYGRQPVIVHPETLHWTPGRGIHTHGHIHVPHGNHYHIRPY